MKHDQYFCILRISPEHFYFRSKFHRNWTNIKEVSWTFNRGPLDLLLYNIISYLAMTKKTFRTYSQGCLWFWLLLHGQICLFESTLFFKVKTCINIWKNEIGRLFEYKTQRTLASFQVKEVSMKQYWFFKEFSS